MMIHDQTDKLLMRITILILTCLFLAACSSANPEAATINTQLGLAYLAKGNIETAKTKLLLAAAEDPKSSNAQIALGYFFARTDETDEAKPHYLLAIKIAKEKGAAWHAYGKFLAQTKQYQLALQYFLLAAHDLNYPKVASAYADASSVAKFLGYSEMAKIYHQKSLLRSGY
jgi:type IV pilus assembly protein PilF